MTPPSRRGALRQEGAGPLEGVEAEVGGGPGLEVHRQRPGAEEEANTLQPEGANGLASVSAGAQNLPRRLGSMVAEGSGPVSRRPGFQL